MTRGNQRELARAKNQKKQTGKKASEHDANKGQNLTDRKQRDADRMREKQEKAAAKKAAEASAKK
ncbi:predicted protein [Nematostella vectensis]|uniref:Small EDRK-rich factor-like N-terminal domain-containing protein n=1 Tax=Nematostella vectensis TaxID=45351 RepID=A7RLR9_NEMVE|nr:predicted protein [Nematostella vectensis]|eukprot:XP_001639804.1 predicted protein [Nematostella vectensis]